MRKKSVEDRTTTTLPNWTEIGYPSGEPTAPKDSPMRTKLVYSAPIAVLDSLEEPIRDDKVLQASPA